VQVRNPTIIALVLLVGCHGDALVSDPEPEPEPEPIPEPDLSGPLYDSTRIVDVSITIAEADWDALRMQTRLASDIFGACPTGPHPNPFTQFHATVSIDGQQLSDVAVRKKGFYGSLDEDKPSLKINTDEYIAGQTFYGRKSLTLNNAKQDPALIKQCLAYQVFAKAGVPASRCNFARVRVNGRDLGFYVNVEAVNKPMLRRHFSDDAGNLYEGALSDFRPAWSLTFDKKTNDSDPDRSDLDAVSAALALPDAEMLAALDPLVDIEEFLDYWAAEVLIGHTDSYSGLANNFLVYDDPATGRFSFLPWGVDNTFQTDSVINGSNAAVAANGLLARRLYLYTPTRDRYLARLRQHLATIWNEDELLAEIDRMAAQVIAPAEQLDRVRQFVRDRRTQITDALAAGPPAWTAPFKPNAKPCFESNGTAGGTFQTTWGTLGAPDVFASGTGTLTGTVQSVPLGSATRIGSASGLDPDSGKPVLQLFGLNPDNTVTVVFVNIDPSSFVPGDVPLGFGGAPTGVFLFTPSTNTFEALGIVSSGSLHLTTASTISGAPIDGVFSLATLQLPF